jgi:hypothetical protein
MDAGVRNHHVAGLGSIATSTSITLDPESENPRLDEHFFAKVPGASEATLTDVKRLVAAAEHHIADVAARQEDEQLVAGIDDDGVSKMAPFGVGRLELKQTVEFARECARIDLDGGVGEIRPSASSRPTTLASGPSDLPSSSGR